MNSKGKFKFQIILLLFVVALCAIAISGCGGIFQQVCQDDRIESFSFIVMADPHASESVRNGYEKFGSARDKFKLCLDRVSEINEVNPVDFVLIAGDIHLWAIEDLISDFDLPVHVVAGNHATIEHKKQLRDFFADDFKVNGRESDYYSFVHKGVRFIGICNAILDDHVGHLSSESIIPLGQPEWLETELNKTEKEKVVFGHIPPHPEAKDDHMCMSRNDSMFFNDLVRRTKPTVMFFGHQHNPKKLSISGCDSYVVRSTSWNFNNLPIGFLLVSFQKDGVIVKDVIIE
jgi:Icc-related predicted phosphoesterase